MTKPTVLNFLRGGGELWEGDCLLYDPGRCELAFADPPFNIGYEYEDYIDSRDEDEYLEWCGSWIRHLYEVLTPTGTFWLAYGDKLVSHLDLLCREAGFARRNWVIWSYRFGTYTESKFSRDHAHLLYYVKDVDNFTWNPDAIRVPSVRQQLGDKRANTAGRVPGSVWDFPRVAGTHKERVDWHPCQMPEAILQRIILACSNPGDRVYDPFAGSGTTMVAARRNGRVPLGAELSSAYAEGIIRRLDLTTPALPPPAPRGDDVSTVSIPLGGGGGLRPDDGPGPCTDSGATVPDVRRDSGES